MVQPGSALELAAQHLTVVVLLRWLVPLWSPSRGRRWWGRRWWLGRSWERTHSYFEGQKSILWQFGVRLVCGDPSVQSSQPHPDSHAVGLSSSEETSGSVSFSFTFSVLSRKSFTSSWSRVLTMLLLRLVADPMRSGRLRGDHQVFRAGRKTQGQVHDPFFKLQDPELGFTPIYLASV